MNSTQTQFSRCLSFLFVKLTPNPVLCRFVRSCRFSRLHGVHLTPSRGWKNQLILWQRKKKIKCCNTAKINYRLDKNSSQNPLKPRPLTTHRVFFVVFFVFRPENQNVFSQNVTTQITTEQLSHKAQRHNEENQENDENELKVICGGMNEWHR